MKFILNPTWLKTFVTLIDTGHFTHTAEKLFMTQPGVSQHVMKLEQACGHALIKRDKKSFEVTEQGRLVYQYAVSLAERESELFEQLSFDNPFSGNCSLACSGSIALFLYPKLLALQVKHRNLQINVVAAPNTQILADIVSGKIDQGIVTDDPKNNVFEVRLIGREELCLVLPATIDVSDINADLLVNLGLLAHPDAHHYLQLYCAQSDIPALRSIDTSRLNVVGSINQISQILTPIAAGIGFTVIPKRAIYQFTDADKLTVLTPINPVVENLYLVKKKNRTLPARYNTINSVMLEALRTV